MKRTIRVALAALIAVTALGSMTACRWVRMPSFTERSTLSLKGATRLAAEITQGVGELSLHASFDPPGAVTTEFTFAPESWRPDVTSSVASDTASVRISQPESSGFSLFGYTRNSWTVTLPAHVETDLRLRLGVGSSNVDLREIDLVRLSATTGVGDTTIDLTGPRTKDLTARIQSGVGNLTVRLPRNVGVKVNMVDKGVGDLSASGFTSQGDSMINAAYAGVTGLGPTIEIDLVRGVGNVSLLLAD